MEIFWLLLIAAIGFFIYTVKKERKYELQQKQYDGSTQQLQKKLEEAADNIVAMIDERNDQLAFLIVEADAKISQLEEKILQFSKLSETELVHPTVQEEMLLPTIESTESDESDESDEDFLSGKGQKEQVLLLRSRGETINEIVKKVGLEETAVKLIIEMNK
ncbi:MAG: hypothetical protein KBI38_04515 [Negativicutes bacterium]|nr:hypothetical protein [Negativicutes bacterium]